MFLLSFNRRADCKTQLTLAHAQYLLVRFTKKNWADCDIGGLLIGWLVVLGLTIINWCQGFLTIAILCLTNNKISKVTDILKYIIRDFD